MNLSSRIKNVILVFIFSILFITQGNAQFNPSGGYDPKALIQRLSYENFKNIKLLTTAIMNFGGGEEEFNKLIDQYSEASALYFSKKINKSAEMFSQNEKEIKKVAAKIAKQFKESSEALNLDLIKLNTKLKIKESLKGNKPNLTAEKYLKQASESLFKGNDLFLRARFVKALYMFRRAKEKCFTYYTIIGKEIPDKYEKDQVDLKNKIYKAKEKKN